jgi:hypothetical protein
MTTTTSGATIHYTTDGSLPGTSSPVYTGPVSVATSQTLQAIAVATGFTNSQVSTANYVISNGAGGHTWYVRQDGGSRYTGNNPAGQCDGQGDAAYPGSGVNQHCAFNDFRLIWSDPWGYADHTWAIAGGDTVIVRGQTPYLASGSTDASQQGMFGWGIGTNIKMSSVPAGPDANHPTRILGENYGACSTVVDLTHNVTGHIPDPAKTAKLYGISAVLSVLDTETSQNVVLACLDVSDHSPCGAYCTDANSANAGLYTGGTVPSVSGNITLQDMDFHGFSSDGIVGNIGGTYTANRVLIGFNGLAGWDFDPPYNSGAPSHGKLIATELGIIFSGCAEQYPLVDPVPVGSASCQSQSTPGYGDGIGTPVMQGLDVSLDHSWSYFNTQDGIDLGHLVNTNVSVTNSIFYGSMGGNIKIGPVATMTAYNNIVDGNCSRMSAPITGAPPDYNIRLIDYCRAGGDQNGTNFLTDAAVFLGGEGGFNLSGNTVTGGPGATFLTDVHVGNLVSPSGGDATWIRTVTAVMDDTHFTVSSPFPSDGNFGLYALNIPNAPSLSHTVAFFYHNSFSGYGAVVMDNQCQTGTPHQMTVSPDFCKGYAFTFEDNLVREYVKTGYNGDQAPGMWFGMLPTIQDYNIYFGTRTQPCTGPHDLCTDPLTVVEPTNPITDETAMDKFNAALTPASPARGAGVAIPGQTVDRLATPWSMPPSMGAYEFDPALFP